jgi:hypothetical protein
VRIGWYELGRKKNPWVALLTCAGDDRIVLKLRVSRDCGFFEPDGPLKRSTGSDSGHDAGSITVSDRFPTDLPIWVNNAFHHCVDRYGITLDDEPVTAISKPPLKMGHPNNDEPVMQTSSAVDLNEPPASRIKTTVSRIVRDTALAVWVKQQHEFCCQICGQSIQLADGSSYAEGHHLRPLGSPHNGPDVVENILCVCPNHHAACDFGAIRLDMAKLRIADGHKVGAKFVTYHNDVVFRG